MGIRVFVSRMRARVLRVSDANVVSHTEPNSLALTGPEQRAVTLTDRGSY